MQGRYEQFSFIVSVINRHIQKIERDEMEKLGYKGAYAQYLVVMIRHPEGITNARLCEFSDKNKAAVSRMISEMEEKGLIIRETTKNNTYNARLKLTEKGKSVAKYVCAKAELAVNAVGAELTEEERRFFYSTLLDITKKLQNLSIQGISTLENENKGDN